MRLLIEQVTNLKCSEGKEVAVIQINSENKHRIQRVRFESDNIIDTLWLAMKHSTIET